MNQKLFPEFMAQLIKDGEKTGTLDTKISAIADLFRARLENHMDRIIKIDIANIPHCYNCCIYFLYLCLLLARMENLSLTSVRIAIKIIVKSNLTKLLLLN